MQISLMDNDVVETRRTKRKADDVDKQPSGNSKKRQAFKKGVKSFKQQRVTRGSN